MENDRDPTSALMFLVVHYLEHSDAEVFFDLARLAFACHSVRQPNGSFSIYLLRDLSTSKQINVPQNI